MHRSAETFISLSLLLSIMFSTIFIIPIGLLFYLFEAASIVVPTAIVWVALCIAIFLIVVHMPYFNVQKLGKSIEGEIAVTGRRLLIQLESGKSLANAIIDVAKHKKEKGKALEKIAYELYMGQPLEKSISTAIANTPSPTFKRIFIQIRNALLTGADLKHSMKATLENITRQKIVEFEAFGKKLNTIGLFYMIFGTIAPSLGVVVFVIVLTILNFSIDYKILVLFLLLILIVQTIFIYIFRKLRPELEL